MNEEGNTTLDFCIINKVSNNNKKYDKNYIAFSKEDGNLQYGTLYSYDENEQSKYVISKEIIGSIDTLPKYDTVCMIFLEADEDDEGCSKEQKKN